MANVYGEGNYGIGNYSAPTNWDAEGSVSVSSSVSNDPSAQYGGIGSVLVTASFSADPNHVFGGIASLVPVFGYEADGVVVIERRGEASLAITPQFSAQASVLYQGEATAPITITFSLDPFGGPYWNPENAEGSWVAEMPPSGIWTPEIITSIPWS